MAYNNDRRDRRRDEAPSEFIEKVVSLNRVSKTVKGGRVAKFSALCVVGDGKGRVGFGHGNAREVPEAISKATAAAKKAMVRVPLKDGRTLHHDGRGHFGAGNVTVRSAPAGTGIIAGGTMRAVFESLGVADVVTKSVGTSNPYNMIRATFEALKVQSSPRQVASKRGKKVADLMGRRNDGASGQLQHFEHVDIRQDILFQVVNRFLFHEQECSTTFRFFQRQRHIPAREDGTKTRRIARGLRVCLV